MPQAQCRRQCQGCIPEQRFHQAEVRLAPVMLPLFIPACASLCPMSVHSPRLSCISGHFFAHFGTPYTQARLLPTSQLFEFLLFFGLVLGHTQKVLRAYSWL